MEFRDSWGHIQIDGLAAARATDPAKATTYIDDCVQGTMAILWSDYVESLNLGWGHRVSINQLIDMVEAIAGVRLRRRYLLDAPKGVHGRNSDNTLTESILGWTPQTPLEVGLEQTYRWIYHEMTSGE